MLVLGKGDEQSLVVTAEKQLKDKEIVNTVEFNKFKSNFAF